MKGLFSSPALLFAVFVLSLPITLYAAFGSGAPTIFNPDVFTDQSNQLRVDGPTGAFTYKIPISIPLGRNGIQPDLSLDYNSQRTEDSIVGYGWSLSLPFIQRFNKTGSQDLYATPSVYTSSIDGELVQVSSTSTVTHRARVDTGVYNSYSFANNTWTVYDKRGTKYTFGSDTSGRLFDTTIGTSTKTYRWMLQEIRDTNNNYATFSYSQDSNELYPTQITYTGNNVTTGPFTVSFATSTRPDIRESYRTGFKVTTKYRISQITAKISGTTVGSYSLSYNAGANGVRSVLTSVQRTGYDESGSATTLPATTMQYMASTSPFYTPGVNTGQWPSSQSYIPSDANGNGINDVVHFYNANDGLGNRGDINVDQGSQISISPAPPDFWGVSWGQGDPGTERGVRFLDVNGDGKADLIKGLQDDFNATSTLKLWINNYSTSTGVYAWVASTTYAGAIPAFAWWGNPNTSVYVLTSGLFGELNGDGLTDYIMSLQGYTGTSTYLGNGSAWSATSTLFSAVYPMPTGVPTNTASQLVDINGDGLDDWVNTENNQIVVRLNNGKGWDSTTSTQWGIATTTLYAYQIGGSGGTWVYLDRGMRFFDINGDGLQDFVRSYYTPTNATPCSGYEMPEIGVQKLVLLNTGNGWATSTAYSLPSYITTGQVSGGSPCNFSGGYSHDEYTNWIGNGQMAQDVMTSVITPQGGSKTITYTPSAQLATNRELPVSLLVVTQIVDDDGFGTSGTYNYAYSGGKVYLTDGVREKKFSGFAVSTTTTPDSITVTYYHQGDGVVTGLGEQTDGYAHINRPFRKDIFDVSGALLQQIYTRSDTKAVSGSMFIGVSKELVLAYGTGGAYKSRGTEYQYATTTNDVIKTIEYGEVAGATNGTFSDIGADKRTTVYTYVASSTLNSSLLKTKTLFDTNNATSSDERRYYDGFALGTVGKGNETKAERLKSGTTYISEQRAYNLTYGIVASSTDPRGNVTNYTYDSRNLYVATSTNPISQATQFYYDYTLGKPKQTIDPNGRIFETTYDGLDRPTAEKQPDIGSPGTIVTKKTYTYTDTVGSRSVLESNYLDGSIDWVKYTYLDGLDRTLQVRKEAEPTNTFSVSDYIYDSTGRLEKESLPYFASSTSRTTATTTPALFTTYTYDALRRVLTTTTGAGVTSTVYDRWTSTVTDPLSKVKDYVKDAFTRLSQVIEHDGANLYTTTYSYDVRDNLVTSTDSAGNLRGFTYDALNSRLTAQDLHDPSDTAFGIWTYVYDNASNLATSTDPKSQVVNYLYDTLNRLTSEDYTGATGTEVQYAYDTCGSDGKGRLCFATSTNAITRYTYNALGFVATEVKTVATTTYTTTYSYNRQGGLTSIVYPDVSEVLYTYNTAGLPETVKQKENGGSYSDIVSNLDYGPHEKPTFKVFANGVKTQLSYDASKLYRLKQLYTAASSTMQNNGGGFAFGVRQLRMLARLGYESPWALEHLEEELSSTTEPEVLLVTEVVELPVELNVELSTEPEVLPEREVVEVLVASSTPETMRTRLEGKTQKEKIALKSTAIAEKVKLGVIARQDITIELVSVTPDDEGVEVFVRAWDTNGEQIGFSNDGTVDEERFKIINPPILVPDPEGDIVQTFIDPVDGREYTRTLREDPEEALYQVVEHVVVKASNPFGSHNIEVGKQGKTTYIFYPDPNPETSSFDGVVMQGQYDCSTGLNFATARSATDGTESYDSHTASATLRLERCGGGNGGSNTTYRSFTRSFYVFNTQSLSAASSIDSASLSVHGANSGTNNNWLTASERALTIVSASPASTTAITTADWDQVGATAFYSNDFGTTGQNWSITGYNDMSLNASGIANIAPGATSYFGIRIGADAINQEPSDQTGGTIYQLSAYFADQTGTTLDPKLTVTTSATGSGSAHGIQNLSYAYDAAGNITSIADISNTITLGTVNYTYDDLHRLTSASTTVASTTPYFHNYAYDRLGNLISLTGQGSYLYQGTGSGNYANPHAPTMINNFTASYDQNGNLTNYSSTTNAWDYRNRLATSSASSTPDVVYWYDHTEQRVRKTSGTGATTTPTKYYELSASGSTIKSIFTPDGELVATITNSGTGGGSSDTGLKTAGSVPVATGWTTLTSTQLGTSDNARATCDATCDNSDDAQLSTFSFSIPSGATIQGIKVQAEMAEGASSGNIGTQFSLSWNTGTTFTTTKAATVDGTTDTTYTIGGSTDTWGRTWTDTELSDTTFRLRLDKTATNDTLLVDTLSVQVFYASTASSTTAVEYIHPDHLGSTGAVTNSTGTPLSTVSYYPYGQERINSGSDATDRHYIGQRTDSETNLSYLQNRYYASNRGVFLNEDPTFWGNQNLLNPQSFNSYSYAESNPINKKDPTGLAVSEYQPYSYPNAPQTGQIIGSYRGSDIYSRGNLSSGSPLNPYQCTVFASDFTQKQFGIGLIGNGNNISFTKSGGGTGIATSYQNSGSMMPKENDILSWSGSTYGHAGVVAQVQFDSKSGKGYVYTAEQNWGTTNGLFAQTLTRNKDGTYSVGGRGDYSVKSWSRYEKNQSSLPTYTTTSATPAPKTPIKKP